MEIVTAILCRCSDSAQREVLVRYMDREQRPDFDDEVAPGEEGYFAVLEYTEYADRIETIGKVGLELLFELSIDPEDDLPELMREIYKAGVPEIMAEVEYDTGDSYYYSLNKGKIITIKKGGRKQYKEFRTSIQRVMGSGHANRLILKE